MQFSEEHRGKVRSYRLINDQVQLVWRTEMGRPMRSMILGTAPEPVYSELIGEPAKVFAAGQRDAIRSAMVDEYLDAMLAQRAGVPTGSA